MEPAEARRQRHREEARRAILDAAAALLVEEGFEKFSMRRLAARCGYTAPTIYHYFDDKPGLIDALVEECFATLVERLEKVPASDDPLTDLRARLVEFVEFGRANPHHYRLISMPRDPEREPPPALQKTFELLSDPVKETGSPVGAEEEQILEQSMWVLVHGLISLPSARADIPWVPNLAAFAIESMLLGLEREDRTIPKGKS